MGEKVSEMVNSSSQEIKLGLPIHMSITGITREE